MKKVVTLVPLIFLLFLQLPAQSIDDSLRYAESIWSMQKKGMILEELGLTEAEKSSFWPVYESYSNAIQYLEMEYIRLQNLTDGELESEKKTAVLTENLLMNELMLAKTRKFYYKKFRKALNPSLASKFMQLDNEFRIMLRLRMQKNPPPVLSSLNRIYLNN